MAKHYGCTKKHLATYKKMLNERYGVSKKTLKGKGCRWVDGYLKKNAG